MKPKARFLFIYLRGTIEPGVCVTVNMTIITPPPELVLRSGLVKVGGGGFVITNDVGGGGYCSV